MSEAMRGASAFRQSVAAALAHFSGGGSEADLDSIQIIQPMQSQRPTPNRPTAQPPPGLPSRASSNSRSVAAGGGGGDASVSGGGAAFLAKAGGPGSAVLRSAQLPGPRSSLERRTIGSMGGFCSLTAHIESVSGVNAFRPFCRLRCNGSELQTIPNPPKLPGDEDPGGGVTILNWIAQFPLPTAPGQDRPSLEIELVDRTVSSGDVVLGSARFAPTLFGGGDSFEGYLPLVPRGRLMLRAVLSSEPIGTPSIQRFRPGRSATPLPLARKTSQPTRRLDAPHAIDSGPVSDVRAMPGGSFPPPRYAPAPASTATVEGARFAAGYSPSYSGYGRVDSRGADQLHHQQLLQQQQQQQQGLANGTAASSYNAPLSRLRSVSQARPAHGTMEVPTVYSRPVIRSTSPAPQGGSWCRQSSVPAARAAVVYASQAPERRMHCSPASSHSPGLTTQVNRIMSSGLPADASVRYLTGAAAVSVGQNRIVAAQQSRSGPSLEPGGPVHPTSSAWSAKSCTSPGEASPQRAASVTTSVSAAASAFVTSARTKPPSPAAELAGDADFDRPAPVALFLDSARTLSPRDLDCELRPYEREGVETEKPFRTFVLRFFSVGGAKSEALRAFAILLEDELIFSADLPSVGTTQNNEEKDVITVNRGIAAPFYGESTAAIVLKDDSGRQLQFRVPIDPQVPAVAGFLKPELECDRADYPALFITVAAHLTHRRVPARCGAVPGPVRSLNPRGIAGGDRGGWSQFHGIRVRLEWHAAVGTGGDGAVVAKVSLDKTAALKSTLHDAAARSPIGPLEFTFPFWQERSIKIGLLRREADGSASPLGVKRFALDDFAATADLFERARPGAVLHAPLAQDVPTPAGSARVQIDFLPLPVDVPSVQAVGVRRGSITRSPASDVSSVGAKSEQAFFLGLFVESVHLYLHQLDLEPQVACVPENALFCFPRGIDGSADPERDVDLYAIIRYGELVARTKAIRRTNTPRLCTLTIFDFAADEFSMNSGDLDRGMSVQDQLLTVLRSNSLSIHVLARPRVDSRDSGALPIILARAVRPDDASYRFARTHAVADGTWSEGCLVSALPLINIRNEPAGEVRLTLARMARDEVTQLCSTNDIAPPLVYRLPQQSRSKFTMPIRSFAAHAEQDCMPGSQLGPSSGPGPVAAVSGTPAGGPGATSLIVELTLDRAFYDFVAAADRSSDGFMITFSTASAPAPLAQHLVPNPAACGGSGALADAKLIAKLPLDALGRFLQIDVSSRGESSQLDLVDAHAVMSEGAIHAFSAGAAADAPGAAAAAAAAPVEYLLPFVPASTFERVRAALVDADAAARDLVPQSFSNVLFCMRARFATIRRREESPPVETRLVEQHPSFDGV